MLYRGIYLDLRLFQDYLKLLTVSSKKNKEEKLNLCIEKPNFAQMTKTKTDTMINLGILMASGLFNQMYLNICPLQSKGPALLSILN